MEALLAFGGVAIGWLLSQLTDVLRDSRRTRSAAKLLWAELATNQAELRGFRALGLWGGASGGPRRTAWEVYGNDVIRAADAPLTNALMLAYQRFDTIGAVVRLAEAAEDDDERGKISEALKGPEGEVIDETVEELYAAMESVRRLTVSPLRVRSLRMRIWLENHHLWPTARTKEEEG
jgi:hypothetical protein